MSSLTPPSWIVVAVIVAIIVIVVFYNTKKNIPVTTTPVTPIDTTTPIDNNPVDTTTPIEPATCNISACNDAMKQSVIAGTAMMSNVSAHPTACSACPARYFNTDEQGHLMVSSSDGNYAYYGGAGAVNTAIGDLAIYDPTIARYQIDDASTDVEFNATVADLQAFMATLENLVLLHLYDSETQKPNVPYIKLRLVSEEGFEFARTVEDNNTGGKIIEISSNYVGRSPTEFKLSDLQGLILHEMVQCLQYNGANLAPQWLLDGIAGYVRIKSNLQDRGWVQTKNSYLNNIDAAYFLVWINEQHVDFIKRLNLAMRAPYSENMVVNLTSKTWDQLWAEYVAVPEQV